MGPRRISPIARGQSLVRSIIHPCVHPEDQPAPKTLGEMFQKITEYIERLMHTVRPRRLLYMAIDGVAPRAKMNQQRSRRFRTAKDMKDAAEVEEEQRLNMMKRGYHIPPKKKHTFDHNVITPGTGAYPQCGTAATPCGI